MKTPFTFVLMALKKIAPFLALVLGLSQSGWAQAYKNEKVIYLNEAGQPIKEKKARFLQQVVQLDDTLWELNYYFRNGPRVKSFRCSDPEGRVLNGRYISYTGLRTADTVGNFVANKRVGDWDILTPMGRLAARQRYEDGQLLWTKDSLQLQHERDSIAALKKKDSDSSLIKIEIESEFPGGATAWLKYLNKNLRYPDEAVNKMIMGTAVIGFVVDKEGYIPGNSVWVARSVEYSIDKEALRIILASPAWTAAVQNGRAVKSYKKQPIVFRLEVMSPHR